MSMRRYLATSDSLIPVVVRSTRGAWHRFTLPAPKVFVLPYLWVYLGVRFIYHLLLRHFIAEPLFKAYCRSYGRHVRTGIYVHWVMGSGDICIGNNVEIRGKCSFAFAARFADRPMLKIGDNTNIGHGCSFVVGKQIEIGNHCLISSDVIMFDSNGHPSDPAARLKNLPLLSEEVRPITIGDNVWIGHRAIISPGVKIGDNSIVSAAAVVIMDVPANVVVAGNPARKISVLEPPISTK